MADGIWDGWMGQNTWVLHISKAKNVIKVIQPNLEKYNWLIVRVWQSFKPLQVWCQQISNSSVKLMHKWAASYLAVQHSETVFVEHEMKLRFQKQPLRKSCSCGHDHTFCRTDRFKTRQWWLSQSAFHSPLARGKTINWH